jgi:hypothetical protein
VAAARLFSARAVSAPIGDRPASGIEELTGR